VKLIQKIIGSTLDYIGIGNNFMNGTLIIQQLRENTDIWDYMELKRFCTANKTSYQTEETAYRMGENLYQLYI
jgi:hypothetical protein